jgi:hypothetical protein
MAIAIGNPSTASSENDNSDTENLSCDPIATRDRVRDVQASPGTQSAAAVAVYWDFENVHACVLDDRDGRGAYQRLRYQRQEPLVDIGPVAEYAATFGRVIVHRAYCNWQRFWRYSDRLQAHAVELVQLFPLNGYKNTADIRLVLDVAEDLQRYPRLTHVVIVGSDIDYTPLAQWCRRQGRFFIGIGAISTESGHTCYKPACDEFCLYRDLATSASRRHGQTLGVAA